MRENERLACLAMLEEIANGPVGVVQIESLGGDWAPVERWRLHGADAVGSSVVIKTRRHDEGGWGGNPRNLVAEHEALAAVQQSGLRLAPGPIAWNEANGILIMQDLAPAQPIERLLYGNDPTAAETALVALASTTGTVQALTNLMGGERWNPHTALDRFPRRWTGIVEAARRLRFPDPSPAAADAASVGTALGDPAWQTFTHTDLAPNNAVIADGVVHLVDFEGAGVRHCMTDGAMFSLSFPQYGLWATMPETVTGKMERAYRSSLAAGLSEANDDVAYDHALATGCAAWTLIRLDRLDKLADPDQDSALALRRLTQIVHTVEACIRVLANTCAYPALHEWLGEMAVEMQRRWPEARIQPRQFPAFAGE